MSRNYEMDIKISGYRPDRTAAIQEAIEQEWTITFAYDDENTLTASGEDSLGGGESEEEFTERLSLAVWKANGEYCEVVVDATYLDDLPYQTHCLDEVDYDRLMKPVKTEPDTP
jgi:hypothetical protein